MGKVIISLAIIISCVFGQTGKSSADKMLRLDSNKGLELINVKADVVDHKGKKGLQISKSKNMAIKYY